MSAPWWMVGVAGLLGGAVGGGVVGGLTRSSSEVPALVSEPKRSEAAVPTEDEAGREEDVHSGTEERVRRLEHRVALLTAAIQERERAARLGEDPNGADSSDSDGSEESATDVADPVFEAAVLDIFDRERERKEEERAAWRKELHVERGKRYAGELSEALGLSEAQQAELAEVVTAYFDQWRALRDDESPERPATRSEWRAAAQRMNASLDKRLAEVLSSDQLEKYQTLDPDQKLGGFGRGRRNDNRDQQAGPTTVNER